MLDQQHGLYSLGDEWEEKGIGDKETGGKRDYEDLN